MGFNPKALSNCTHLKWIQFPYNFMDHPTGFGCGEEPLHCTPLAGLISMNFFFEMKSLSQV